MTSRLSIFCVLLLTTASSNVQANETPAIPVISEDPVTAAFSGGPVRRTQAVANDAALNDVCGIGSDCWAVGERGVILRSRDTGVTWETQLLRQDVSLRSVGFLTGTIGYVGGEIWNEFERRRQGFILKTRDAGQSWAPIESGEGAAVTPPGEIHVTQLPPLEYLRFFDLENAVAVSAPDTPANTSHVYRTANGGKTWQAMPEQGEPLQLCGAAFHSPDEGIVVGQGGAYAAIVDNQQVTLSSPTQSLRSIRAASLNRNGGGWLVGDGGLLLQSHSRGVTWNPPPGRLSPKLNDIFDYRSVAQKESTVCVAGRPGGVVLHSADDGRNWSFRALGNPATLNRLRFINDLTVIAVGTFGVVHRSDDRGLTWATVRNKSYRAAILHLTSAPNQLSFETLADVSADQGFRTVVECPSVDLTSEVDPTVLAGHTHSALRTLAVNTFEQDWRFSRDKPLQQRVRKALWESWSQQTDSRVAELLPLRLAESIRIWRPDIICIDDSRQSNEVVKIWQEAMPAARAIASGGDKRGNLLDKVGLNAWTVTRVIVRNEANTSSPLTFSPNDTLKNLNTTSGLLTTTARSRMPQSDTPNQVSYSDISDAGATPAHLLMGCIAAPGTDARRMLTRNSDTDGQLQQIAKVNANLEAVVKRRATTGETPLGLIANLSTLGQRLPPRLRLRQLQNLSEVYESVGNLDGQIAVLKELVDSYPDDPEAASAAEQLFQFYSSSELRHIRRLNEQQSSATTVRQASGVRLPGLTAPLPNGGLPNGAIGKDPVLRRGEGTLLWNSQGADTAAVDTRWNTNAGNAYAVLQALAPTRSQSAKNLLRLAASHLRTDKLTEHRSVLSKASRQPGLYGTLARAELQAMHSSTTTAVPVLNLPRSKQKPVLDAVFTDECWQNATDLHLRDHSESKSTDCLVMLAWDDDHVYIAGRVEYPEGRTSQMDQTSNRLHDSDHGVLDRVMFSFDTDRDHTTAFHFVIDEAGQTSERCWTNTHWNPQWYVACESDDTVWRFEAAIPQQELLHRPLRASDLWGMQLERIVPGKSHEVWSDTDAQDRGTRGSGLLRFIRNTSAR